MRDGGRDLTVDEGIAVIGIGTVSEPADLAHIELGVAARDSSVRGATDAAASLIEAVISAIREQAAQSVDVASSRYHVHPDRRPDGGPPRGYVAEHVLSVTLRELERTGSILEAATRVAGDAAEVHSLRLALDPTTQRMDQARTQAWADAVHKATELARLAGRPLGRAAAVVETQPGTPPAPMARLAASEMAAVPVEPGEAEVSLVLSVRFHFAD